MQELPLLHTLGFGLVRVDQLVKPTSYSDGVPLYSQIPLRHLSFVR